MPKQDRPNLIARRSVLRSMGALGAASLLGLPKGAFGAGAKLALDAPIPAKPAAGTLLRIADVEKRVAFEASGLGKQLPFNVEWANVSSGPAVLQAFRARAIDVGTNGGIPPLLAKSTNLDVKIVAIRYRTVPAYTLATAPGSKIADLGDLRGKKLGFSSGQEQGLFVLQSLRLAGIPKDQVTLVRLTSAEFQNALASKQVDAAPISEPQLTTYLRLFARDGAIALRPDIEATPNTLTVSVEVLEDADKAAALREYVKRWYASTVWAYENKDAWISAYYVKDQRVTKEDGQRIVASLGSPTFASDFKRSREIIADANDLLITEGVLGKVDVGPLFDDRFAKIAAETVAAKYLEGER